MAKKEGMLNLKVMRIKNGMTQKELAGKVNIEFHAISAYENGWRFPKREILVKLAEALNCQVRDII